MKYWLGVGAQPSPTVTKLLARFNFVPTPAVRRDIVMPEIITRALAGESITGLLDKLDLQAKGNATPGIADSKLKRASNLVTVGEG